MAYYLRLFSTSDLSVSAKAIAGDLPDGCRLDVVWEDEKSWRQLVIATESGDPICQIERTEKELVVAEIEEFREKLLNVRPTSGATWVIDFLTKTNEIYACQVLHLGFGEKWGSIPAASLWAIKNHLSDGIMHAGDEGFSNEEGHHITWEFASDVRGPWAMAVRSSNGGWACFDMDLGNLQQRQAFLEGRVPDGSSRR